MIDSTHVEGLAQQVIGIIYEKGFNNDEISNVEASAFDELFKLGDC
ncbi:MAG: hypothetical protein HRT37_19935 [Alteromonadaceae bacterium]|nr:hypothetical protein [Alteromonadaceae bacterium]